MAREIKFRGKSHDGEWVYGDLHLMSSHPHIHSSMLTSRPIDISTIGQYTGLKDKNGKEIYEGDILCIKQHELDILKSVFREIEMNCVVEFRNGAFIPVMKDGKGYCWSNFIYDKMPTADYTVIGNIHDNPELLKGGEG